MENTLLKLNPNSSRIENIYYELSKKEIIGVQHILNTLRCNKTFLINNKVIQRHDLFEFLTYAGGGKITYPEQLLYDLINDPEYQHLKVTIEIL